MINKILLRNLFSFYKWVYNVSICRHIIAEKWEATGKAKIFIRVCIMTKRKFWIFADTISPLQRNCCCKCSGDVRKWLFRLKTLWEECNILGLLWPWQFFHPGIGHFWNLNHCWGGSMRSCRCLIFEHGWIKCVKIWKCHLAHWTHQ